MAISLYPVTAQFASEVGELDISRPIHAEDLAAVRAAFTKFSVLVFPAQQLSGDDHLNFARNFGPLETNILAVLGEKMRVSEEIADVANLDANGRLWEPNSRKRLFQMGNRLWHTDSSFKAPTAYASMLYARSIPPIGGHTEFADLRAAYAALPASMKQRLEGLMAHHSLMYSRAKLGFTEFNESERKSFAPVRRPLVRVIAETGQKSLYLAAHIGSVEGMSEADGAELINELTAHCTQRQFVYTHRWRVGDLVMWDNRCTMHRGTEFEDTRYPRDMQRATTSDAADAFGVAETETAASVEY